MPQKVIRMITAASRGFYHFDNNRLENLCYGTHKENFADALAHGRWRPEGYMGRLTKEDVWEIRKLRSEGIPAKELARRFGVCQAHIHGILKRTYWKHI